MRRIIRFLESVDIFDKFSEVEYHVKTISGALLSLFLAFFGSILFVFQIAHFLTPDLSRNLGASRTTPGETTLVNISLTIHISFPCHFLHLDTRDTLGFSQLYANTVTLRRYASNGTLLGLAPYPNRSHCHPCFDARPTDECCNSCEELVLLYRLKNLTPSPENWPQCSPLPENLPNLDETCNLKGKLTVNKVRGLFVVRFTRGLYNASGLRNFNLSHVLGRIRFGPKVPWTSMPLEAIRVTQKTEEPLHYLYELVCTPVIFVRDGEIVERTYEYLPIVTTKSIDKTSLSPGLFFLYQFTPYTVTVSYRTKSLSALVSATFGILSGGFAITSFLDRFLYKVYHQKVLD
jgi:hypothetical protein